MTRHPLRSATGTPLAAASALLALALATGCAGAAPAKKYVWPPPPEKARVESIRAFRSAADLRPSFWQRALRVLLPYDTRTFIQTPTALALAVDERTLYVACGPYPKVIAVHLEDRTMEILAGGDENAPLSAFGVAVDGNDDVYVSDRTRGAVMVYDRKGRFLRKIGAGKLEGPADIAIDRPGQQLYVFNGTTRQKTDHRIEVFSLKGEHLRTIGKRGEGPGEFNFPSALAVSRDRKLYVADKLNFRVEVFDPDGKFLEQFGQVGRGAPGAFDKIRGMAFDTFGNFYIVDTMQGVQILNPRHRALMTFASPPSTKGPYAIEIDSKNRIYLSDFAANVVIEFQLVNTTAEDSYAVEASPAPTAPASPPAAPSPTGAP